jgi:hypothetical protein
MKRLSVPFFAGILALAAAAAAQGGKDDHWVGTWAAAVASGRTPISTAVKVAARSN